MRRLFILVQICDLWFARDLNLTQIMSRFIKPCSFLYYTQIVNWWIFSMSANIAADIWSSLYVMRSKGWSARDRRRQQSGTVDSNGSFIRNKCFIWFVNTFKTKCFLSPLDRTKIDCITFLFELNTKNIYKKNSFYDLMININPKIFYVRKSRSSR